MANESADSRLADIAKVELTHAAEIRRVQEEGTARVTRARQEADEALSGIPALLQDERRTVIEDARAEGEAQAVEIRATAEADAARLSAALDELTGFIVEEVFHMVLPEAETARNGAGGAA